MWTDWTLSRESQEYVASLLRGPVALSHPFIPDAMNIITYNDAPPEVMKRLLGAWNWWAPGPLRRLHDRFGWSEAAPGPTALGK